MIRNLILRAAPGFIGFKFDDGADTDVFYTTLAAAVSATPPVTGTPVFVATTDQQGGQFEVRATSQATDGCICFPFDTDLSDVVTEVFNESLLVDGTPYALQHQNVAFGTVQWYYHSTDPTLYATDLALHGHRTDNTNTDGTVGVFIDHAAGTLTDHAGKLKALNQNATVTVKYQYVTATRRLVRVTTDYVAMRWIAPGLGFLDGATAQADARDYICWAANAAKRLGLSHVLFDKFYTQWGTVEWPQGVVPKGDDDVPSGVRFIGSDLILGHYRSTFTAVVKNQTPRWLLGGYQTGNVPASGSTSWGAQYFRVNGNYQENSGFLTDDGTWTEGGTKTYAATLADIESELQNTPYGNAFNAINHNGRVIPADLIVSLRGLCHFYDTLGSGHGSGGCTVRADHLWIGTSLRNHGIYCQNLDCDYLQIDGSHWGTSMAVYGGHLKTIAFTWNLSPPFAFNGGWNSFIQKRYNSASSQALQVVRVDKMVLDLSACTDPAGYPTRIITGQSDGFDFGQVKVRTPTLSSFPASGLVMFDESQSGFIDPPNFGWRVEQLLVEEMDHCKVNLFSTGTDAHVDAAFADFKAGRVVIGGSATNPNGTGTYSLIQQRAFTRGTAWGTHPKNVEIGGFVCTSARNYSFTTDVVAGATPLCVTVRAGEIANGFNQIICTSTFSHLSANLMGGAAAETDKDKIEWRFEDFIFNLVADGANNWSYLDLFLRVSTFRNVTDRVSGNRSEYTDHVTFTASPTDASNGYKLIALPLWWAPSSPNNCSVVPRAGALGDTARTRGVTRWEVTKSDGSQFAAWNPGGGASATQDRRLPYLKVTFGSLVNGDVIWVDVRARVRQPGDPILTV